MFGDIVKVELDDNDFSMEVYISSFLVFVIDFDISIFFD